MSHCSRAFVSVVLTITVFAGMRLHGQAVDRITNSIDSARLVTLASHHPQWAKPENDLGLIASDLPLEQLTLVLSRSPQQEQALRTLLAEQQDLTSPNYHHWLTPAEMGERFGLSLQDIAMLSDWLQSQGLHVNWVSPSRMFLRFGGTAGTVGRAFQTGLHAYQSSGSAARMSVSSEPVIPQALAPAIQAIHGLYTIEDRPMHSVRQKELDLPNATSTNGEHFLVPGDIAAIYDYPDGTPNPTSIAIVGRSRTNLNDFAHFRQMTQTSFSNPSEIVPTQFGGVDPGPALTSPPSGNVSFDEQSEATLDVAQAASMDGSAQILLVVATAESGGIEADAQYLVETSPLPAPVMSISFGACESASGPAGVAFWDTLFQQAAAEGISAFVAAGDAGAVGCDEAFASPPATPRPDSPNYICSSSYATCVGGTEFDDASDPAQYWGATGNLNLQSALSYIPEGGWNEPLNREQGRQVAASGGGVSSVIPTPAWQIGAGVPAARSGRYTPDLAFAAANHDGYFACFAAAGGTCVTGANGLFPFVIFSGTSASAPLMAGIAGLLVGETGAAQGNLNAHLYELAFTTPAVFHDVTVTSSGVTDCVLSSPSICNNSIAGSSGYLLSDGYDQVTGLGSLDILNFLHSYPAPPNIKVLLNAFIIQANAVTIAPGALAGNTSGVAITPANGFTGNIALSASITSAPPGAQHLPTFSFGNTSPVNIVNRSSGAATLTVLTTAPTADVQRSGAHSISWYTAGGASLAWLLVLGVPLRSRRWRAMLGMVLLSVCLSGGMMACSQGSGGSASSSSATGASARDPGTTAGTYTVTITGTAGTITQTGTVDVIVQ